MRRGPDHTLTAAGRTVIDGTAATTGSAPFDLEPMLAEVRRRALVYLDDEVRTHLPKVAADLRRIVEDWSDADAYASAGATINALMADSPLIRGAVTRRLSSAPRRALANALADLQDEDLERYDLLQARLQAVGLRRAGRMRPEEVATVLDRFRVLDEALENLVHKLGAEQVVVPR